MESSVFLVDGNDFAEKDWNYWRISLIIQVPVQQTDNALPRPLSSELEQYIAGLLNEKLYPTYIMNAQPTLVHPSPVEALCRKKDYTLKLF